jgi:hypothetical protein
MAEGVHNAAKSVQLEHHQPSGDARKTLKDMTVTSVRHLRPLLVFVEGQQR